MKANSLLFIDSNCLYSPMDTLVTSERTDRGDCTIVVNIRHSNPDDDDSRSCKSCVVCNCLVRGWRCEMQENKKMKKKTKQSEKTTVVGLWLWLLCGCDFCTPLPSEEARRNPGEKASAGLAATSCPFVAKKLERNQGRRSAGLGGQSLVSVCG